MDRKQYIDEIRTQIGGKIIEKITSTLIVLVSIVSIFILTLTPDQPLRILAGLLMAVTVIISRLIAKNGRVKFAAILLVIVAVFVVAVGMYFGGGVKAPVFSLSLVVVGVYVWFLGIRPAILLTTTFIVIGGLFVLLEQTGVLPQVEVKSSTYYWLLISCYLIIALIVTFIPSKLLHQALIESKKKQEELEEAKKIAEKSDRLKTEFLAQISHEIRTPVNSIMSFSSLLSEYLENYDSEDMKYCCEMIHEGGDRLIRTIDLILNMSEVQLGTYQAKIEKVDLHKEILDPLYQEFKPIAQKQNLDFELINNCKNSFVEVDKYTCYQIFSNLIDNAIKYTEKGKVEINIFNNDKHIHVKVKDTGVGISKEYLKDIFKPFTQEQQGYTRKFEGNGLGLALVNKYCKMNNATINIESEKEKGSEFIVEFSQVTKQLKDLKYY